MLSLHRFFLKPRLAVATGCVMCLPCREPRYVLHGKGDAPKPSNQAQAPRLRAPKPQSCSPKKAERPWDWAIRAVSSGDESHVVFVSPHRRPYGADKFNIGFHAPPSSHPDGARRRGGEPASVSLFPPPSVPLPKLQSQCDPSTSRILLNPALSSYVLCVLCSLPPVPARRKLLVAHGSASAATIGKRTNVLTHLVSPSAQCPPSPSPTASQGTGRCVREPRTDFRLSPFPFPIPTQSASPHPPTCALLPAFADGPCSDNNLTRFGSTVNYDHLAGLCILSPFPSPVLSRLGLDRSVHDPLGSPSHPRRRPHGKPLRWR